MLDFATGEIMQYLPRATLDGTETFIWTEAHYNPANDMLAVGGCYWAAPYALLLADFSNPMSAPPRMTDALYEYIPNFWDDYDGEIDFHAWRGTDLLYTAPLLEEKKRCAENFDTGAIFSLVGIGFSHQLQKVV